MDSRYKALSNASLVGVLAANAAAGGAAVASDLGVVEHQGSLPAVSGVNTKVGSFGAHSGDATAAGAFIALALPLGMNFGAQIDGIGGAGEGGAFYGVGGHLFWRDPSRGLLGAYAGHLRWDADASNSAFDIRGAEVGKVGLEGQLYLNRLSLEGMAAYQFGTESGFAGKGTAAYYVLDDLRIHLTVNHLKGPGFAASTG